MLSPPPVSRVTGAALAAAGGGEPSGVRADGTDRSSIGALPRSRRNARSASTVRMFRGSPPAAGPAGGRGAAPGAILAGAVAAADGNGVTPVGALAAAGGVGVTLVGAVADAVDGTTLPGMATPADAVTSGSTSTDAGRVAGVTAFAPVDVAGVAPGAGGTADVPLRVGLPSKTPMRFGEAATALGDASFALVEALGRGRASPSFDARGGNPDDFTPSFDLGRAAATSGDCGSDAGAVARGGVVVAACVLCAVVPGDASAGSARPSCSGAAAPVGAPTSLTASWAAPPASACDAGASTCAASSTGAGDAGASAPAFAVDADATRSVTPAAAGDSTRGCGRSTAARATFNIERPNSPRVVKRRPNSGAATAIAPMLTSATTAAAASRRPRRVGGGGNGGGGDLRDGRRRNTAGASNGSIVTRGVTMTRSGGASRVTGVAGDVATGVTLASRASVQPDASETAMSAWSIRAAVSSSRRACGCRSVASPSCTSRSARISSFAACTCAADQPPVGPGSLITSSSGR